MTLESRIHLTRQFLQQRDGMKRMALTPVDYVAYRLGVSVEKAERLVHLVRAEENRTNASLRILKKRKRKKVV